MYGGVQAHSQGGCPGPHLGGPGLGGWPTTRGVSRPRPWGVYPSCTEADDPPADGYCCGRYASYWNAFLFWRVFVLLEILIRKVPPSFDHSVSENPGSTTFLSMFSNWTVLQVKCLKCRNTSETHEPFMDLSLEFPDIYHTQPVSKQAAKQCTLQGRELTPLHTQPVSKQAAKQCTLQGRELTPLHTTSI